MTAAERALVNSVAKNLYRAMEDGKSAESYSEAYNIYKERVSSCRIIIDELLKLPETPEPQIEEEKKSIEDLT